MTTVKHARATRPYYLDKLVRSNVLRHYPAICPTFDQGLEICYTETQGQIDTDNVIMVTLAKRRWLGPTN